MIRMLSRWRWIVVPLVALLVAAASVLAATNGAGADGVAPQTEPERFTNYRAPTGPELIPQAIAAEAATRARDAAARSDAGAALSSGPVEVQVAHGSFATTAAVLAGHRPSEASLTGTTVEQTEQRQSTAYIAVIKGDFAPNVPIPRGAIGPRGDLMVLIMDAHNGFVEEMQIGGQAPILSELGQVFDVTVGAASAATSARRGVFAVSVASGIIGRLYERGTRTNPGRPLGKGRPIKATLGNLVTNRIAGSTVTRSDGRFFLPLKPGTYRVFSQNARGRCPTALATVKAHRHAYVRLQCNPTG